MKAERPRGRRAADEEFAKALGKRITEARGGMSVADLANAIGCAPSFLYRVESGENVPGANILLAIAQTLHVSLDALFGLKAEGDLRHGALVRRAEKLEAEAQALLNELRSGK